MGQLGKFDETTESSARLRQLDILAELVPVGILALDRSLACVFVNGRWCDLSGLNYEESWRDGWQDAVLFDDRERFLEAIVSGAEEATGVAVDVRLRTPLGRVTWVKFEARAQFDYRGRFDGYVATVTDVSDHIQTQKELLDRANYDLLSHLPNRSCFEEQLTEALTHCGEGRNLALLYVDLDDFKDVNDTLGHDSGDEVIRIVAQRMRNVVRAGDLVGRLGGDEFAILLYDMEEPANAGMVADKVIAALTETIRLQDQRVQIGASIGIATTDDRLMKADLFMKLADKAMYHAKRRGKNRYQFATGSGADDVASNADLRADVRRAVRDEEFELYFQPQFAAHSGTMQACEALIRWRHPESGVLPPAHFLPILEELDLLTPVTAWVVSTACRQLAQWRAEELVADDFAMAVNVQGDLFHAPHAVEMILECVRAAGIPPHCLCIEITETAIIHDEGECRSALEKLRLEGLRIALDDFGTGYSSLNHLRQFRVDTVKIDHSFLSSVTESRSDRDVTRLIVQLARRLGLQVVAEGVDSEEKLDVLRELGCDGMQGFLYGEPVPRDEFASWLRMLVDEPFQQRQAELVRSA